MHHFVLSHDLLDNVKSVLNLSQIHVTRCILNMLIDPPGVLRTEGLTD